jgi:hypothetical protein
MGCGGVLDARPEARCRTPRPVEVDVERVEGHQVLTEHFAKPVRRWLRLRWVCGGCGGRHPCAMRSGALAELATGVAEPAGADHRCAGDGSCGGACVEDWLAQFPDDEDLGDEKWLPVAPMMLGPLIEREKR